MLTVWTLWVAFSPTLPRRAASATPAAHRDSAAEYLAGFEPKCIEGIGGGTDLLATLSSNAGDVVYTPSLSGTWRCQRSAVSVEGDMVQAAGAWYLRDPEQYLTRYVLPGTESTTKSTIAMCRPTAAASAAAGGGSGGGGGGSGIRSSLISMSMGMACTRGEASSEVSSAYMHTGRGELRGELI